MSRNRSGWKNRLPEVTSATCFTRFAPGESDHAKKSHVALANAGMQKLLVAVCNGSGHLPLLRLAPSVIVLEQELFDDCHADRDAMLFEADDDFLPSQIRPLDLFVSR